MNIYAKVLIQNILLILLIAFTVWYTESGWGLWALFFLHKVTGKDSEEPIFN